MERNLRIIRAIFEVLERAVLTRNQLYAAYLELGAQDFTETLSEAVRREILLAQPDGTYRLV